MILKKLTIKRIVFIFMLSFLIAWLTESVIVDSKQGETLKTELVAVTGSLLEKSNVNHEDYDDLYYSSSKAFSRVTDKGRLVCLDFPATEIGSVELEFEQPLADDSLIVINWNQIPINEFLKIKDDFDEDDDTDKNIPVYSPYKTTRMWADAGTEQYRFSLPVESYTHLDFYVQQDYVLKDVKYSREPLSVTSRRFNWTEAAILSAIVFVLLLILSILLPVAADNVFSFVKRPGKRLYNIRKSVVRWLLISIGCIGVTALYEFGDYVSNDYFCFQKALFCFCLLMMTSVLWFNRKHFKEKIDKIMFALILITGFMIVGTNLNSNTCFDGDVHYRRALKSSYFFSDKAVITQSDAFYIDSGEYFIPEQSSAYKFAKHRITASPKELSEGSKALNEAYTNGNYYITDSMHHVMGIAYLPYSLLLFLCRAMKLPFSLVYMISKCGNLLVYAVSMYLACRRLSSRKLLFAVLALLPMHIFMAGNYSYDGWLIGLITLSMVYIIEEFKQPNEVITNRSAAVIFLAMGLGIAPKPVYFPLILTFLLLPKTKFRSAKHRKLLYSAVVILSIMAVAILAYSKGGAMEGVAGGKGGDIHDYANIGIFPLEQMKYVLKHPGSYILVVLRHLMSYFEADQFRWNFGDWKTLGCLSLNNCIISMLLILLSTFVDVSDGRDVLPFQKKQGLMFRSGIAVSAFLAVLLICTALYCGNTYVGAKLIEGVQPRYFIPLLFPLSYLITKTGLRRTTEKPVYEIALIVLASLNTTLAVKEKIIEQIANL